MVKDFYPNRRKVHYTLISRNGSTRELYNYSGTRRQSADRQLNAQSDSEGTDAVVDVATDP